MSLITDEELNRLRARIGQVVSVAQAPYLTEVTRDAIRHWAWATGDKNKLYLDEAYAKASPYGALLCPPSMLYAFSRISIGYRGGLPGVHSMFGGSWWRWHEPSVVGDRIDAEVTFKDLVEFPSRFAGRMFKQTSEVRFTDQTGRRVATADAWGMRVGRAEAREKKKYEEIAEPPKYTKDDIARIAALYAQEHCRGATPLYFEDVEIGMDVPEIVRGPYTATCAVAFEQAWGGLFIWAHGYWFDLISRHPALGIANAMGVPEPPEAVHWDTELARSVGVPQAYDYGPERISWMATMLTNWIGDHGFLTELYGEMRRFNMIGDITYCRGQVTERIPGADGTGTIKLNIETRDQRDQQTAKGWAKISLPMRG